MRRMIAMLAVGVLCVSGTAGAATVTLAPAQDNTIYQGIDPATSENFEDNSCGAGTNLFSGRTIDGFLRRALVRFDVAGAIPAGSTIQRVVLTIDVNRSGDSQNAVMRLHPLARAWGEGAVNCDAGTGGGGQGLNANTGDATWRDAKYLQVPWSLPGGDSGAASGSAAIPTYGSGVWDSAATGNGAMTSDVQVWLDTPAANAGWVIIGDETRSSTTRRFSSREGAVPPMLTVEFTPVNPVYACCFIGGDCSVTDTASCEGQGGTSDTTTSTCSPNPCPQPTGACCNLDESCSNAVNRDACITAGGTFQGGGTSCSKVDCGLTPFLDPLPIPPVAQPIATGADGSLQYEMTVTQQRQELHSELPPTDVWTYNGSYPGPTIEARSGQPIEVTWTNGLPLRRPHYLQVDPCAEGANEWRDSARIVTHLHGGHVPARFDGQPGYTLLPGEFDVYRYPNEQLPSTLWYHDEALGIARLNVYMGLTGFYLLRDDIEVGLGLPSNPYEIPLAIQDRTFDADGTLLYPPTLGDRFFGDKALVNGKVWPYLNVKQGKYRFRILNGSQARAYKLRLENLADPTQVIPFQLIGTDGGLIDAPRPLDTFTVVPAERFDVVVDFAGFPAGTEIVLRNDDVELPLLPNVMKFMVTSELGHTAPLPATLRPVVPIPVGDSVGTRRFSLKRVEDTCAATRWVIRSLDATGKIIGEGWNEITETPRLGSTEIWAFENGSNMMHAMHVHMTMFQVLDRVRISTGQTMPLDPWEAGTWKDTVRVPGGTRVRVIARFEDQVGRFPYQCTVLDDQDHAMQRQFQTVNDPGVCVVDGVCAPSEDCVSCPADCPRASGARCGNHLCEIDDGETCRTCPEDCAEKANGPDAFCCGIDAGCEDQRCASGSYYCRSSASLPACCGDAMCEGQETSASCLVDCGPPVCVHADRRSCNADLACRWDAKSKSCIVR